MQVFIVVYLVIIASLFIRSVIVTICFMKIEKALHMAIVDGVDISRDCLCGYMEFYIKLLDIDMMNIVIGSDEREILKKYVVENKMSKGM